MLATTIPPSWPAQFLYVMARFGLGLEGCPAEPEN